MAPWLQLWLRLSCHISHNVSIHPCVCPHLSLIVSFILTPHIIIILVWCATVPPRVLCCAVLLCSAVLCCALLWSLL